MKPITFFDIEVEPQSNIIKDIGGLRADDTTLHSASMAEFKKFLSDSYFICGHNILMHDLKYLEKHFKNSEFTFKPIDTLYLSPLLFPSKPYHKLVKDDKLCTDELNNPLNDSKKAKDLFYDLLSAFNKVDRDLQKIFYHLLHKTAEFSAFFEFIDYWGESVDLEGLIKKRFNDKICTKLSLSDFIKENKIELAYCLALINAVERYSITPRWVLAKFPEVEKLLFLLRNNPCTEKCDYCAQAFDALKGLKNFFGHPSYRTFDGEPMQEMAVNAAIKNSSILTIFPTGGGKSITFQVPALMSGKNNRALTVVISPLQALMKDQVDNLEANGITEAVTINGLLDPIERTKAIERLEDGSASLLYIAPESLRSRTLERILIGRNIARFVIDEAHCFSSWGQDFRVDYMYIADFIKKIQETKRLQYSIPVSCFTATAKLTVIDDIKNYFKDKLGLELELFSTSVSRKNLQYKVYQEKDENEKFRMLRALLDSNKCPTIIYVSRTKDASDLAEKLIKSGYEARAFHGKMDPKEKIKNQEEFTNGKIDIMVATSAFGMGVDKKDIGLVVHYQISDSLENYVQEAGRAGRNEKISANCYVLFNEEDLNRHFMLLNQTKLRIEEINQIWKVIRNFTKYRESFSSSAKEIAMYAGWDLELREIETRVRSAIYSLEDAGFIERGQNSPCVFATGILSKNYMEAEKQIQASMGFTDKEKQNARRVISNLISQRQIKINKKDDGQTVDQLMDVLGLSKEDVIKAVTLLRETGVLADSKDLKAYLKHKDKSNALRKLEFHRMLERFILSKTFETEATYHIKKLNKEAEETGIKSSTPEEIKQTLNYFKIAHLIKCEFHGEGKNKISLILAKSRDEIDDFIVKKHDLAKSILEYLYDYGSKKKLNYSSSGEEIYVEFSELELKKDYESIITLTKSEVSFNEIENALFYLTKTKLVRIDGGFMVIYNPLQVKRKEHNKKQYGKQDFIKLKQFYESKMQQIHIVGEYAKKMIENYKEALEFVNDYFQMDYENFLDKYFKGRKQEITRNITPGKFREIIGELSISQFSIINDKDSKYLVVGAGPGSGKTKLLVHKLASLLYMEDVKHEQLLMLTFSRSAVTEFKKRLISLIGNSAYRVEITTFYSYCFDLLGRIGSVDKLGNVINEAIEKIRNDEVENLKITKTALVIDEAQDMNREEFELVKALIEKNEDLRVIAVGDDDQSIFEFRNSSSKYFSMLLENVNAKKVELTENYRSKNNLVQFTNEYVKKIGNRMKVSPIEAKDKTNGSIKIIKYCTRNLAVPLVQDLIDSKFQGSTCVLVRTNNEAEKIAGLLKDKGIKSKLIQDNNGFNLINLLEIRFLLHKLNVSDIPKIDEERWKDARASLIRKFPTSRNLELCTNLMDTFETTSGKAKYKVDFELFIRESRIEDFFTKEKDVVYVSTMHKAKGREFDNVFIALDNYDDSKDENKRVLYVAMTRAKQNLTLHINGNLLDDIEIDVLNKIYDNNSYSPPQRILYNLSLKDVWLDGFIERQDQIVDLISGDELIVDKTWCKNKKGQNILRFSNGFIEKIGEMMKRNYMIKSAKVNYVVYWKKEDSETEIRVLLPEVIFEKVIIANDFL
jgi:ATP-dependent DNA helicase RecQ